MTYDEAAEKRRKRAEFITGKTKNYLVDMILEFHKVAGKKTLKGKNLDVVLISLVEKYEKRITSFIREQLTSDDR
jgi:hypothetical protein